MHSYQKAIVIYEYKADTKTNTHKAIDLLPYRRKDTIQDYLKSYGTQAETIVMGMNPSSKAAVKKSLNFFEDTRKNLTEAVLEESEETGT